MREEPTPMPQSVTRRRFIKRSGGATVGTAIGLYALQTPAWAVGADDSSGKWWSGSAVFKLPVELDHDKIATEIMSKMTIPPAGQNPVAVSSQFQNEAALKTHLGWNAQQKTKKEFTQTVTWEEFLTKPDGTGDPPSKFRRLGWSYGGNHFIDIAFGGGALPIQNNKKAGFIFITEGYYPTDKWELGGFTVTPATNGITGGTGSLYLPSGEASEQPGDKAVAVFGTMAANFTVQPMSLTATGDWNGTNDTGVGTLEVRHATSIYAWVVADLLNGHRVIFQASGVARLKLEAGKQPTITTIDWQNNRQPKTSNGTYWPAGQNPHYPQAVVDDWFIRIKRPGTLVE